MSGLVHAATAQLEVVAEIQARIREGRGWRHSSIEALVLELGREFALTPPLPGEWRGERGFCYRNAIELAVRYPELVYVEGYGTTSAISPLAVTHAWCVTAGGVVVDPTWDHAERAYLGVPLDTDWVLERFETTGHYSILASNYHQDWDLLRNGLPPEAHSKVFTRE